MITAHAPSGYVLGRLVPQSHPWVFPAALFGGVFPDLDLLWFYLIDDRAFHHHRYWVHAPAFWAIVGMPLLASLTWLARALVPVALAFLAGTMLHICLDSIAGDVMWLWPLDTTFYTLITIPAVYDNWIWNFILHPVFALELMIWAAAILVFVRARA